MTRHSHSIQSDVRGTAWLHRRLVRVPADRDAVGQGQALAVFRLAIWLGLVVSMTELFLKFVQKPLIDSSPGLFRMNRHIFWMIPAVHLVCFCVCGILAALTRKIAPKTRLRTAVAPSAFLACLTFALSFRWLHLLACLVVAVLLAIRLTWRIEKSFATTQRLVRRSLPAMGLLMVFCMAGPAIHPLIVENAKMPRSVPATGGGIKTLPNVLLISLDTVRADHLSLHGYERDTTPNLVQLARRGVVFHQARSTAPWTLPSHATMLTGRWPHEMSADINRPLDATYPTLAEYLSARGYATAGFVGNTTYCGAESGLSRGFEHFEDHDLTLADALWNTALGQRVLLQLVCRPEPRSGGHPNDYHREDAGSIRRSMMRWVQGQKDRPFFAFLNLYDAHNPYIQPKEFSSRFTTRPATENDLKNLDRWFIQDKSRLSTDELQFVLDAYDDGIAYLDEQLGLLFDDLREAGRLDNTLVIVTSDHGEELGEHGLYGHASSLYDGEIRVPLMVFNPGQRHGGTNVNAQVSLRDLAATIVDVAGLADSPFPGDSLARYWREGPTPTATAALTEVDAPVMTPPNQGRSPVFRGPMKAVTLDGLVYIANGDGKEELYDVESDPRELRDLSSLPEFAPTLDRLRSVLNELKRKPDGTASRP